MKKNETTHDDDHDRHHDQTVVIGCFAGVHGVRGGVHVQSYTARPEDIFSYHPWLIQIDGEDDWLEITPSLYGAGHKLIASIPGIKDRDAASRFARCEISVRRSNLPPPEEGQFYWCDLLGMAVYEKERGFLGRIHHVLPTGSNDVLCVRDENHESLIPWRYGETILSVDMTAKRIDVVWQEPE